DGEIETEVKIIIDNTDKKRAEKVVEVIPMVASKTNTGVTICDAKGEIIWINSALEKLIGYSSKELQGKMLGDVLSTKDTDFQVVSDARKAAREKKSLAIEILALKKDGTSVWLS